MDQNLILPHAKFTYNDLVNKSTGLNPFEIVTGRRPKKPVDLVPMSIHARVSESVESFAKHIRSLHDSIHQRLEVNNEQYKCMVDAHRRQREFQEDDYVIIKVRPEWFPSEIVKKLQSYVASPFQVQKRVRSNAYVMELPDDYGISSTFNVSDLVAHQDPKVIPIEPFEPSPPLVSDPALECPLPAPLQQHEQIEYILLYEQVITTRNRIYNATQCSGRDAP